MMARWPAAAAAAVAGCVPEVAGVTTDGLDVKAGEVEVLVDVDDGNAGDVDVDAAGVTTLLPVEGTVGVGVVVVAALDVVADVEDLGLDLDDVDDVAVDDDDVATPLLERRCAIGADLRATNDGDSSSPSVLLAAEAVIAFATAAV